MNYGKIRTWYSRASSYISIFNFIGIIYLVISNDKNMLYLIPIGIAALACLMVFDIKKILPQEMDYAIEKTPILMDMSERIKKIERKVKA